jgi:hypothetical protein
MNVNISSYDNILPKKQAIKKLKNISRECVCSIITPNHLSTSGLFHRRNVFFKATGSPSWFIDKRIRCWTELRAHWHGRHGDCGDAGGSLINEFLVLVEQWWSIWLGLCDFCVHVSRHLAASLKRTHLESRPSAWDCS